MAKRPTIGIALSGASGRAIAHIGVLEVLKKHNIPVDFMVGCSSGALIAAAYVTNTLPEMKEVLLNMTMRKLLGLTSTKGAKGAIFHLHNADEQLKFFTKGLKLEETYPRLGFAATDIHTGELINITHGDMIKAVKASVAVPGLFEPAVIDNRVLVDGGLVNIVPTKLVQDMGADIVIGINIAGAKFIYEKRLPIWRGYKFITRVLGLQFIRERVMPWLSSRALFQFDSQSDVLEEDDVKVPGVLSMLVKALDWSLEISDQWDDSQMACDYMIEPRVKHYGKTEFKSLLQIYEEGRRAAEVALPEILNLLANYQKTEQQENEKHEYQTS